jgi:outer membrane lipoprotein carrier protein
MERANMSATLRQWLLVMVIAVGSGFSAIAQAESPSDTLTHLLVNTRTMQADFSQTVMGKKGQAMQEAHGHMALERPGKFRWEVKTPTPQLIIANGKRLWIYDPDLQQVTIRSFSKSASQTPAFLLSDANVAIEQDYNVEAVAATQQIANAKVFLLSPKNKDNMFANIKLTFMGKQIHEMQLRDHLGHLTIIAFQHVKLDAPLAAALFVFTPSSKIDVIDETRH